MHPQPVGGWGEGGEGFFLIAKKKYKKMQKIYIR